MKRYSFLGESYGSFCLGGGSVGFFIARRYMDELRNLILNSDTPQDAIQAIENCAEIKSDSVKKTYTDYIKRYSGNKNWKVYVLEKIEIRKIIGIMIGTAAGAGLAYGFEQAMQNN